MCLGGGLSRNRPTAKLCSKRYSVPSWHLALQEIPGCTIRLRQALLCALVLGLGLKVNQNYYYVSCNEISKRCNAHPAYLSNWLQFFFISFKSEDVRLGNLFRISRIFPRATSGPCPNLIATRVRRDTSTLPSFSYANPITRPVPGILGDVALELKE